MSNFDSHCDSGVSVNFVRAESADLSYAIDSTGRSLSRPQRARARAPLICKLLRGMDVALIHILQRKS